MADRRLTAAVDANEGICPGVVRILITCQMTLAHFDDRCAVER
ncbi:hypothetical protein KPATCC21470_1889 [Kitasatospora purpeofusca]